MPGQFEGILDKLQTKLGKQTIKRASTINRPRPKREVQQINIFNEFNRRNPKADGGSVNGSEQAAFRAKVEELMDDGYDFGEAVREAMRQGYDKGGKVKKYKYKNPLQKNQYIKRTDSQIQKIVNDPKYKNFTRKDFRNKKILTRKETERKGVKFKNIGARKNTKPKNEENVKRSKYIKKTSGSNISLKGSGQTGSQFAHFLPKVDFILPSTKDTGPLKASVNRSAEGFDKAIKKITNRQKELLDKKPKGYKNLIRIENFKAQKLSKDTAKSLPKGVKGTLGYFMVNPDTGKFKTKGVNTAKTFSGLSGVSKTYLNMTGKERKNFERKQSVIQKILDKNKNLKRASSLKIGAGGGSGDMLKQAALGPDLIDIKSIMKKPYKRGGFTSYFNGGIVSLKGVK
jgi:hypothetical protein